MKRFATLLAVMAAIVPTMAMSAPKQPVAAYAPIEPVRVRFGAVVRSGTPLAVTVNRSEQYVAAGNTASVRYRVRNTSTHPVVFYAAYKVTPRANQTAFQRLLCFCYDRVSLPAGATTFFTVQYRVAPTIQSNRMDINFHFFPAQGFNETAVRAEMGR